MNRLSPLIARSQARSAVMRKWTVARAVDAVIESGPDILDDLKLFAVGWLGGLIFFGTLLA